MRLVKLSPAEAQAKLAHMFGVKNDLHAEVILDSLRESAQQKDTALHSGAGSAAAPSNPLKQWRAAEVRAWHCSLGAAYAQYTRLADSNGAHLCKLAALPLAEAQAKLASMFGTATPPLASSAAWMWHTPAERNCTYTEVAVTGRALSIWHTLLV